MDRNFHNVYTHGFVRAAVCIPSVRVADPAYNAERTLGLARRAHDLHAAVALFPELGISAYTNDDLFHQDALLDATTAAIRRLVEESRELMESIETPEVLDVALIIAAQKVEHYEIAAYGTMAELANALQETEVAELLTESYRILAPKRLAATVHGPPETG